MAHGMWKGVNEMKDQRGTSLVSVIVSFAVMMIVLLLLQVSITASGRYAARADELWKEAAEAENKYVNDPDPTKVEKAAFNMSALEMIPETGGEANKESWGHMEKWQTKSDDTNGFKIYYLKEGTTP